MIERIQVRENLFEKIRFQCLFFVALSSVNGKKSRKNPTRTSNRSKINFSYEKPQLRSASASSISSSPSPPTRKTRGKLPSRLAAKN